MRKLGAILSSLFITAGSVSAIAQSSPNWATGFVPNAAQWDQTWRSKMDIGANLSNNIVTTPAGSNTLSGYLSYLTGTPNPFSMIMTGLTVNGNTTVSGNTTLLSGTGRDISIVDGTTEARISVANGNAFNLRNTLHMSQSASINFDGTRTWSGSQGAVGNAELYSFTNQTGSSTTGNPIAFHYLGVALDTVQSTLGKAISNLRVDTTTGAGILGGRINILSNLNVSATPGSQGQYVAGAFETQISAPAFASGSDSIGYGSNPTCGLTGAATGTWSCVGEEIDVGALAGSTPTVLTGIQIVAVGYGSHGSRGYDSAYVIGNASSGNTTGWDYGFRIGGPGAPFPIQSSGTLIYAYLAASGNTITNGIDVTNLTFTGSFLKSTGFTVDGAGATNLTNLTFASLPSGTAATYACFTTGGKIVSSVSAC